MTLSIKMTIVVQLMFVCVVMAAQPSPRLRVLLTYDALGYIIGGRYVRSVDFVFARGAERMVGEAPSKAELSKFKDVDYYVTIGAPIEKKIEKTLLELNPRIKVFVATNDCHLIEHNYYLWYSVRNLETMYSNCHEALDPGPYMSCLSLSDFAKQFERETMIVGVTHGAFEYWCRFWGIRYAVIPEDIDETNLKARGIRIIYKAHRGIGACVCQMAKTGVVVVEADPFVSSFDLHADLLDPYREVLHAYRLEEEEKEWKKEEVERLKKGQNAKSRSESNLRTRKTSALRSAATDVIEK